MPVTGLEQVGIYPLSAAPQSFFLFRVIFVCNFVLKKLIYGIVCTLLVGCK